jgi:hypothetical protein
LIVLGESDLVKEDNFEKNHKLMWRYFENLFSEASQRIDSVFNGGSIQQRHRYLMNVMHTLGASFVATYVGFIGYFIIKIEQQTIIIPFAYSFSNYWIRYFNHATGLGK